MFCLVSPEKHRLPTDEMLKSLFYLFILSVFETTNSWRKYIIIIIEIFTFYFLIESVLAYNVRPQHSDL